MNEQRPGQPVVPGLGRRELVLGGAALLVGLAGCARQLPVPGTAPSTTTPSTTTTTSTTTPPPPSPAPAVTPTPAPTPTHAGLFAQRPFYVAHRGGGANWPEMTAYAYRQAAALPFVQAIEISVCRSADGVLVCSHDPTTLRVTGADHEISRTNWSTLSRLMVTPEYTDDPDQPARPFSRLDEVLDDYLQRLVVFIEPKTPDANDPLLLKLIMLNQPQRTVWKQPVDSRKFLAAKEHGFATWGYVLSRHNHLDHLERYASDPSIDSLGIGADETDAVVSRVVEAAERNGKQVMMWPISSVPLRTRALSLGCRGLMTSNIRDLPPAP